MKTAQLGWRWVRGDEIVLQVIQYPHPTLRHVSKPLKRVDAEMRAMIGEMFALMYQHNGVGLAANQVDLPYRVFVVNLAANPAKGEEMVFVNPVLSRPKGLADAEEGCLSLPELYGQVNRPETVVVDAYTLRGEPIHLELDGLLARVVQHETDHLNGRLFIDRLSTTGAMEARPMLHEFELQFQSKQQHGEVPSSEQIVARLAELEGLRT